MKLFSSLAMLKSSLRVRLLSLSDSRPRHANAGGLGCGHVWRCFEFCFELPNWLKSGDAPHLGQRWANIVRSFPIGRNLLLESSFWSSRRVRMNTVSDNPLANGICSFVRLSSKQLELCSKKIALGLQKVCEALTPAHHHRPLVKQLSQASFWGGKWIWIMKW